MFVGSTCEMLLLTRVCTFGSLFAPNARNRDTVVGLFSLGSVNGGALPLARRRRLLLVLTSQSQETRSVASSR